MRHSLEVSVTRAPVTDGVVRYKHVSIRERVMRLLFGEMRRMWIIIPNTTVNELRINEIPKGGEHNEPD